MSIRCVGMRNNKYLIQESEPNVTLQFTGKDAERFEQVDKPHGERTNHVEFGLTVDYCRTDLPGLLPMTN